ncbi:DUF3182 family protein [Sphingobium ummariense]
MCVTSYFGKAGADANEHDRLSRIEMARRLARLTGGRFDDRLVFQGSEPKTSERRLWIPLEVLTTHEARELGISEESDLFGGVVPYDFVATKIVTHGLISSDCMAPDGWASGLADALGDSVLRGFSAFSIADIRRGAHKLLERGPIRLKDVRAKGEYGQITLSDRDAVDKALAQLDPAEVETHGIVLEENLEDVVTYSVGCVRLPGCSIAYWGTQRLTMDNDGACVYGGSQLHVIQGDLAALVRCHLAPELADAIIKAEHYDRAVFSAYPETYASRRNYDVVAGRDGAGERRVGVLEQSWRAGGASGAEIAALEAFTRNPELTSITCATMEVFGDLDAAPPDAMLYYRGVDPVAGPLVKYAVLDDGKERTCFDRGRRE